MEYHFRKIEQQWQQQWKETGAYQVSNTSSKPKFYVLDMFPYPSGAGLHVGHPLGYIASDIYARYKRLKGFNVLHPMGYDSFGLPAEQYALETGQHPALTTEKNIATFRSQLDKIGFCFDWSRELRTSDAGYYKWTQWIFLQLFNSWYNPAGNRAESIDTLTRHFETSGSEGGQLHESFTAEQWKTFSNNRKQEIYMHYRLAYSSYGEVNWCEALGTVLANDEVVNGLSERGGYPVIKKKMRQWYLRITAYADRLLEGLEQVSFSESLKEQQRNWIGKSQGAEISFRVAPIAGSSPLPELAVYTTRPDTIFGVDFMVIAPEHELVPQFTTPQQQETVSKYLDYVKSRSDRERMAEVKQITGCFTGAYAINPFNGREIPIWIAEYVLAGYGTGAIMAVPCGDERDYQFARHFQIPITNIIGHHYDGSAANPTKDAILTHSDFLNGMVMRDAMEPVISRLEAMGIGRRRINYRMRDAGFSRQRYWGEPFPIIWNEGQAQPLDEKELPLELPHADTYGPGPEGEGPLANLSGWVNTLQGKRETSTMPGYAGSSWYFLRYMDPHNDLLFCDRSISDYWNQVDVYVGGTEHAVGHLLYSRMWTKFLYDRNYIGFDEPFKRLVNQGMITGVSVFIAKTTYHSVQDPADKITLVTSNDNSAFREADGKTAKTIVFRNKNYQYETHTEHRIPTHYTNGAAKIDEDALWQILSDSQVKAVFDFVTPQNRAEIVLWQTSGEDRFILGKHEVEKMSKSKLNTFNPDDLVEKFGADTFRMYEMFLGPIEASKPWDTKGIEGVHRFLKKLWRLFYDEKGRIWTTDAPNAAELKILHRTIKKIEDDTERFSFNTAVSGLMICVNDLHDAKCHKKAVLEQVIVLITPYAPHIAAELWQQLGNAGSVLDASYPVFDEKHVQESSKEYPVSVNGRVRTNIHIALDASQPEVEEMVLANETVQKWLEGKSPKKVIYVKNKMINVVI